MEKKRKSFERKSSKRRLVHTATATLSQRARVHVETASPSAGKAGHDTKKKKGLDRNSMGEGNRL